MPFWTYIVVCADSSYYTGHTDDLEVRLFKHNSGEFEGFTSKRLPVRLVYTQEFRTREEAIDAEVRIKGWSRAKKEALIAGDWERIGKLAKKKFEKRKTFRPK